MIDSSELKEVLVSQSVRQFLETEDSVYPIMDRSLHRFGLEPYPSHYEPYFIEDAILETLLDYGVVSIETQPSLIRKITREISIDVVARIPDYEAISLGRLAASNALNNYAGEGRLFSLN